MPNMRYRRAMPRTLKVQVRYFTQVRYFIRTMQQEIFKMLCSNEKIPHSFDVPEWCRERAKEYVTITVLVEK